MNTFEIKEGHCYSSPRWKGDRKITKIMQQRDQVAVVHYIDLRTSRTGSALLPVFAANAAGLGAVSNI